MFTLTSFNPMFPHNNEGRDQLLKDYDLDQLQEIADNGCESGVCSQHIYYADTIAFFNKYEGEILDLIHTRYGVDELVSIFKRSEADFDMYKNECCWLFIENVAQDAIIEMEERERNEDEQIQEYMKPVERYVDSLFTGELNKSAEQLMSISGVNPPNSMTLNRYMHH